MEPLFTLDDLRRLLRVADAAELTAGNAGTGFADLGYDSLAVLEFGSQLRRQYGIRIPDDTLLELRTPQQAVAYVNGLRAAGAA